MFDRVLTFSPLAEYWQRVGTEGDGAHASVARRITRALEDAPALCEPITDLSVLDTHRDLVDLLMTAVIPPALWDDHYVAISTPFEMNPVYATPAFEALAMSEGACFTCKLNVQEEALELWKSLHAYRQILKQCYEVDLPFDDPVVLTVRDADTGLSRHFRIDVDPRFCEVRTKGALPGLDEDELHRLLDDPMQLSRWAGLLPPDQFAFHGFVVVTAMDVTDQEVLSTLKNDLLQKEAMTTPEQVAHLQAHLRSLLRIPDLEMGLICLERNDARALKTARAVGRSLLIKDGAIPFCSQIGDSIYGKVQRDAREPAVVPDLDALEGRTEFEDHLINDGYRNVMVAPLLYENSPIGLLELASKEPGRLTPLTALRLRQSFLLFATALKRSLDEQEDRIQAIIKEKYTAIHPLVEWRFREAAHNYMRMRAEGESPRLEPIVFHDVYPLYGLSDIRDSSAARNDAIRQDLLEQLALAHAVVAEAGIQRPLPALDEIAYRIDRCITDLETGLQTEDEFSVLEFLRHDVEALFDHLQGFGSGVKKRIEDYRSALDPDVGALYHQRKAFEKSIAVINDVIGAFLEAHDRKAQDMFPHYFEKYKTDGVDYNIYMGASLLEDGRFEMLYLQNMRLWQLLAMCGIVWRLNELLPKLPTPMDVTHLILVQSAPLSIRFRQDEKQFDVDGAYNMRYEIVKKRIDKATVKGLDERITQPGKIAIVYTQAREAEEYLRYIDYLQNAGYLTGDVEALEVEELQGTYGLKALRVTVAPERPDARDAMGLNVLREVTSSVPAA